jgi:hypothetical protein
MDLLLQQNLLRRDLKTLLFQPVNAGGESSYLVYLAPEKENDGHFKQEDGGVVWFSETHPDGVPCETKLISKDVGDMILDQVKKETEQNIRRIERY